MTLKRKIWIGIIALVVIIQFFRPTRNISLQPAPNEIATKYNVPEDVQTILKHSCYDCHSNNTTYPWYSNLQPVGWWLQWHIDDAKRHLNFSEFAGYPEKRAKKKFEEIEDAATNGWMPLDSYTWMHEGTRLTPEQGKAVASWAAALK